MSKGVCYLFYIKYKYLFSLFQNSPCYLRREIGCCAAGIDFVRHQLYRGVSNHGSCVIVIFLHYFHLTNFFWMFVEGTFTWDIPIVLPYNAPGAAAAAAAGLLSLLLRRCVVIGLVMSSIETRWCVVCLYRQHTQHTSTHTVDVVYRKLPRACPRHNKFSAPYSVYTDS